MLGKSKSYWRRTAEGYLFVAPWIIGFLAFTVGPLLGSMGISFTRYEITGTFEFIGLDNYTRMVVDRYFWQSLKVTVQFLFSVPMRLVFGFLLALLLNQKLRGISLFRTLYYLPSVTAGVAVSLLWIGIFNPRIGVINVLLEKVGITGPTWLGSEEWAMPALIVMSLWGVGGSMLIYLGALQGVPTELYEAATLDGAGALRRVLSITIPMVTPVLLLNLIMGVIGSFQSFTTAYVMTDGGPNYATLFYVLYLYKHAFVWYDMGYAAALSWVLFLIILVLTYVILSSSERWVYYAQEG
jgi:multiple sugar transport system permease protein